MQLVFLNSFSLGLCIFTFVVIKGQKPWCVLIQISNLLDTSCIICWLENLQIFVWKLWREVFSGFNILSPCLVFNTLMSSLNQTVRDKTNGAHVILRGNFSGPVSTTDLVKSSKGSASLVVYTRKKILVGGLRIFVSDVISGGLLGHLGPLCLALGPNC